MSGSAGVAPPSTGPLTSGEIVAVRRYCGYGPPSAFTPDVIGAVVTALPQDYVDVVRTTFLANLYLLESDIPATRGKLSIDTAAVFKRNAAEVFEREGLFRDLRLRLCATLGIDSGPYLSLTIPAVFVV